MRLGPRHLAIAVLALASACTRSLPSTFPSSSAASLDAAEAPAANVGRALREEPPLPGEPTDGWEGLESSSTSAQGGHTHAH